MGVGALGFAIFRAVLSTLFTHNLVWFEFWEEAAELIAILTLGATLWKFRRSYLAATPILNVLNHGIE